MNSTLTIEVHFDLICPWCLIGKRHLATALQHFRRLRPKAEVDIVWRGQELLPDTPLDGLPYQAFYERRLGGPAAVAARRAQVQEAASLAGIEFAFERIQVLPNTRAAHRLIALAAQHGTAAQTAALIERLFTAYFMDGEDIGDRSVLWRIAVECGLGPAAVAALHSAGDGSADTLAFTARPSRRQVSTVPSFVFNGRFPMSGAHPPATLLEVMQMAAQVAPPAELAVG